MAEIEKTVFPRDEGKTAADSPKAAGLSGNIVATLKQPPEKRYQTTFREIINHYKATEPEYADGVDRLVKAIDARRAVQQRAIARVMVMEEMPKPRDAFVLTKGAYDKPTEKVTAGVPAVLPPLPDGRAEEPPGPGPLARLAASTRSPPASPSTATGSSSSASAW